MRRLRLAMVLGLAALQLGCLSTLRSVRAGERPGAREVVLVGEAGFDPPIDPGRSPPGVWDAFGVLDKVMLGFTFSPDTPVNFSSGLNMGVDVWAAVKHGQPFVVAAPRRTLYLRAVRMYTSHTGYMTANGGGNLRMDYLTCTGRKRIDVSEADEFLYVGRLLCEHRDEGPVGLRVRQGFDELYPRLAKLVGPHEVVDRVAVDMDVSAAGGEQVHVTAAEVSPITPARASSAGEVRPAGGSASGAARITGALELTVEGRPLSGSELAQLAGYELAAVEIGGRQGEVGPSGAFSVPVSGGAAPRLDHLVLKGPGPRRRAVFFPARTTRAGESGCVGTLRLAWQTAEGVERDEFPALERHPDCPGEPLLALVEPPELPLPDFGEPLLVRLASAPFLGMGAELGRVGGMVALVGGARMTLLEDWRRFGTLATSVRATLSYTVLTVMGGLEWGPGRGHTRLGAYAGLGRVGTGYTPAFSLQLAGGTLHHDVSIFGRVDHFPVTVLGTAENTFSFGVTLSPLGALGWLL